MEEKPKNGLLILSGILLLVIFISAYFFLIKGQDFAKFGKNMTATVSTASVTVGNDLPVASGVLLDSDIHLTENTTTHVSATGTVTDNNGCADLASVSIAVHKDGATCSVAGDAVNSDTCYFYTDSSPSTGLSCEGGIDTSYTISHTFDVQYYADSGNWNATIIPTDLVGLGTTYTSASSTLNPTKGIAVSSLSYGSVSAGATSTGNHIATTTNTGNVSTDVKVLGSNLTLEGSESIIEVGNEQYATSSFSYGSGTVLTGGESTLGLGLELPAPAVGTVPVTDLTYWQVEVPFGVKGTFTGNITFNTF